MKNILSRLCFLVLFSILLVTGIYANGGKENHDILKILKASCSPDIDGELDEIWMSTENIPVERRVKGSQSATWLDSFVFFRIMWDEQNIYLYVTVYDDELSTDYGDDWEKDGLEFFFDGDNSKNSLSRGFDNNDRHFRWIYGQSAANQGAGLNEGVFKITDYGFVFETAIPQSALNFDLKEENLIGFDLQYNDNDGKKRQHILKWWSESDDNWRSPSVFGTAELSSQTASDILDINFAEFSPDIDGVLDEGWYDYPLVSNNRYIFLSGKDYINFEDWNDSIVNFRTMWDKEYFYLFAEILDNDSSTNAKNDWEKDSLEIYFDGNNSKGSSYDGNDVQWRWVYNESLAEPGPDGARHIWKDTASGYNFELRIPKKSVPFKLSEGQVIGFELQHNDNDYGQRRKVSKWWSMIDDSWQDPRLFGTVKLVNSNTPENITVRITSPDNNLQINSGKDVLISAEVNIREGSVNQVEFYINDKKAGVDKTVPFIYKWTSPGEGIHKIYAVAMDSSGSVSRSSRVAFSVIEDPDLEKSEKPVFSHEHGFYDNPLS